MKRYICATDDDAAEAAQQQRAGIRAPRDQPLNAFFTANVRLCFVAAFQHDHNPDFDTRKVITTSGARPYLDLMKWIAPATLIGCPATTLPVSRTAAGLPVSLQIVGPYMEDATPIDIAIKVARLTGGFVAPPGYVE